MRRPVLISVGLLCLSQIGCQDAPIDSMTLYSLDGTALDRGHNVPAGAETFHEYPVLGKLDIAVPSERAAILAAVEKGIADGRSEAKCFWPRHGVRLTRGGKTIEYLICFECLQLNEYVDGKYSSHAATTRSPAEVLDKHLVDAGLPQQKSPIP